MRREAIGVLLVFVFSVFSPMGLSAATKPSQLKIPAKTEPKKPLIKIDIKKITLGSEEKGVVPSGIPLMVLADVNASEDIASPFIVNLELKKAKESQKFTKGIEKLSKGLNSLKWDLTGNPEDGAYTISVEIVNEELKLKDKSAKTFRIGEKKAVIAKSDTAKTEAAKPQTVKSQTTKSGPSVGVAGSTEDDKNVNDIIVSGSSLKQMTIAGVTFTGNFIKQPSGAYLVQGEIKPTSFKISLGAAAAGQLTVDKDQKRIDGQMYVSVPVFGKVIQITDFTLAKNMIKFNGKFEEKVTIPVVHAGVSLAKGTAVFEVSTSRFACTADGGVVIDIDIPNVGKLSFDVVSGSSGFSTSLPPEGITVTGSGTVTIPFEPPIEVALEGTAEITKSSLSGNGSATIFDIVQVGDGTFDFGFNGIMTIDANIGAMLKDYGLEANVASTKLTIDLRKKILTGSLSQSIKVMDLVTIPGSVKGALTIDGGAKLFSLSGAAGIPLTGTAVGPDALSVGVKNFLIKVTNYNSSARTMELNGDLYISVWTLAGFNGKVEHTVLNGKGNFYLPPGLKQILDIDKVSLPVKIDLKSGEILGELGGEVAGLAIKHFPLEGPQVIVKKDGVHLKGQIGISHVITIPLGDLVFTQNNSYTSVNGDIGIGPFTVAEGNFIFPSGANEGIGFSGKMGIPGLSSQKISGTIYKEGKVDLSSVTKIGFINVDGLTKFSVSADKLHADTAGLSVGLGGLAKCALTFSSLDITKSMISGTATGRFTGILGIDADLRGGFSFDGNTVVLTYPDAVSLCGMSVSDAVLRINPSEVSGSGKVTIAGQSKNVSISVENGMMKLKGPAGELIAEGLGIANKLKDTVSQTASEEQKVVSEDANNTKDNLSRMSEPWINDAKAAAATAKSFFNAIDKIVSDEVFARVKSALDILKKAVDAAVAEAKKGIDAAVDGVCDGIIALINSVKGIFSDIESLIPTSYSNTYYTIKNKVISKADALKDKVVSFRDNTKASLYALTSPITAIYQGAIDYVTGEADKVAAGIKSQVGPVIKEIDQLLTEMGQEVEAGKNAVGDEAKRHYDAAKQKADLVKGKANSVINNFKNKISDLVTPYIKPIIDKITSREDEAAKKRDEVIAKGIEGLQEAKKTLDPYIQPFEDAVKELKDFLSNVGGAAFQKFLQGVGAAGNALNSALGTAGKGLVKATDLLGDGVVAASNAAANASQAAHEAAAAAANAASQAASQTYAAASNIANTVQQQATSTVNNVISHLSSISPSSFATGSPVSFSDIQSGAQTVSAKVSSILNALDGYATSAYNTASSTASSVGSAISGGASSVASGVSSRWKSATRSISSLWGSSSPSPAPTVNYTAPEVTNIAATSTTTSITVTWNTSFAARTIIFYGSTPNLSFSGQDVNTTVASINTGANYPETTSHSITVNGLNSGTNYYYIVYAVSIASDGNATNTAKKGPYLIVTQPSTAIIGGVVKDSTGNAIPGAKIYLGQATTSVATTDATGRYTLEVNPGAQTVTAKKDNYITSSATTASLAAGQILPLDFTLTDGHIYISGTVKDSNSNIGIASATVTLTGLPTSITATTDASGTFSIVPALPGDGQLQFTIAASKVDYTTYTSSQITLDRGARMQNIEIKLPHALPSISGAVGNIGATPSKVTISFHTQAACNAFVQFGPQSGANYLYQTAAESGTSSFSFDLSGLTAGTTYKYRIVLQDNSGNTVIANEGVFITSSVSNANSQNTSGPTLSQSGHSAGRPAAV